MNLQETINNMENIVKWLKELQQYRNNNIDKPQKEPNKEQGVKHDMKLIDISAWQEEIDWNGLQEEGIEGVIIKIGEYDELDEMFVEHVNNAVAYGFKYGIYFYAHSSNETEAEYEAHTVDEWLKEYLRGETPELGIWYDAEDDDMQSEGNNVASICMAFVNKMTELGYTYVGIYSSWNWFSEEGSNILPIQDIPDYVPIWCAQYSTHNDLLDEYPNKNIDIWQYSDHYSDEFPYDADIYYGDDE